MKLSILNSQLLEALQRLIGVVERKHAIPILTHILLEVKEGVIHFTATDLEIQLSATAKGATIENPQKVAIPGRKFFDIIRNLSNEEVVHLSLQKESIILETEHSRFSLKILPADDFPTIEEEQAELEWTMLPEEILRLMEQTAFCMAQNDARFYLNGLLLELSPHYFRTAAMDGHRLAQSTMNKETGLNFQQCIIPRKSVLELIRILASEEAAIQFSLGKHFVSVRGEGFYYVTKLIDGRYPNYSSVIPKESSRSLIIVKDAFKQSLSRALILSNEKYKGVQFHMSLNELRIESQSSDSDEACERIAAEFSGEEADIGFNASYFLDIIPRIIEDKITICFSDTNQAAFIHQRFDNFEDSFVIMPMLI